MPEEGYGNESEDDIGSNCDRTEHVDRSLSDFGVPALGSGDHGVPAGCDGFALGQLNDVGQEGTQDLHGDHGPEEYPPALGCLEPHEQKGDADLGKGNAPAPWKLADEEELSALDLVWDGSIEVVSTEAMRDSGAEKAYLEP